MLLTVIIPTYNIEQYLRACLDSVMNQTYKNLEILIIDDNSSDSTPDIIKEYAANDDRIKPVFHTKNHGPGNTRNEGLDMATGDYVTCMDHDDWQDLTKYEKMMAKAVEHDADIVFCNAQEYEEETGNTFKLYKRPEEFEEGCVYALDSIEKRARVMPSYLPPWAKVVRADLIYENRVGFSPGENKSDDITFHFHLAMVADSVCYIDDVLYTHRFFKASISGQHRDKGNKMIIDRLDAWAELEAISKRHGFAPKHVLAPYLGRFFAYIHLSSNTKKHADAIRKIIAKHDLQEKDLKGVQVKYYRVLKRFGPVYKRYFLAKKKVKRLKKLVKTAFSSYA